MADLWAGDGRSAGQAGVTSAVHSYSDRPAYYVAIGGVQSGPFDLATISSQVASGRITAQTLVWTQGMAQWTPAGQVPALAGVVASVPPPLPPNA